MNEFHYCPLQRSFYLFPYFSFQSTSNFNFINNGSKRLLGRGSISRHRMLMQTTFFFISVFPPPSSCPEIFTRPDGPCTGCTTNTYKAPVVKWIVRDTDDCTIFS